MRTRLTRNERRADILDKARRLMAERGLAATEMEDIRLACGISRGGLYHHFQNKRAILDALIHDDVAHLVEVLETSDAPPIPTLLRSGSSHLGEEPGVLAGLTSTAERLDYLSSLEQAFTALLRDPLQDRLVAHVAPGTDAAHVAELFLTVTAHINRREILGEWTQSQAAGFAATALTAVASLMRVPSDLAPIISDLREKVAST